MRIVSLLLSVYFILTGVYILTMPETFYRLTPGLDVMGPFNMHFIRDVALSFLVSGGAMLWGSVKGNPVALLCGAAWPFLHGVYHGVIWGHRGFPFDHIWVTDVGGVIIPGFLALFIAARARFNAKP